MALSGNGEPNARQELDLSGDVPSAAQHDEILESVEMQANVGRFSGRIAFRVRGQLVPTAELISLWMSTGLITLLAWAVCHTEQINRWATLVVCAVVGPLAFVAGLRFLSGSSKSDH
jgi:CHASE2 domain-containing sensor protein